MQTVDKRVIPPAPQDGIDPAHADVRTFTVLLLPTWEYARDTSLIKKV
jgi:hypothetical protein